MTKVVFVLIDGLSAHSIEHMAYLAAHVECGAMHGSMPSVLPTLSRPIYATLFTGISPLESGIVHNDNRYLTSDIRQRSFFAYLHERGYSCAVSAYYWFYELYHGIAFDPYKDRWLHRQHCPLPYGVFYMNDAYPDDHVLYDAVCLQEQYTPDFLLVHTMGVDYAGHQHGFGSRAYRHAVRHIDMLLALHIPVWLNAGSTVIVTADHGMHEDAIHNDLSPHVRHVPFWILQALSNTHAPTHQRDWEGLLRAYFP